jgi:hypothetical protein
MARPQSDKVDYFSHDCDAAGGKTLTIMRGQFGLAGAGFWWSLLEGLGTSPGHFYDGRDSTDLEFLLRKLGTDLVSGTEMLDKLAFLGAIDKILWEHRVIWSQNFVDRLADVYEKRKRPLPQKPCFCDGNCKHAIVEVGISGTETPIPVTEMPQSKVKYSKVNNIHPVTTGCPRKTRPTNNKKDATVKEIFTEMHEYFAFPEKISQDPIPSYGKEGQAIKRMLARGFTREAIVECWKGKVSQRGGEFVSMTWVNEDIGKPEKQKGGVRRLSTDAEIAASIKEATTWHGDK